MIALIDLSKVLSNHLYIILLDIIAHPESQRKDRAYRMTTSTQSISNWIGKLKEMNLIERVGISNYRFIDHSGTKQLKPDRYAVIKDSKVNYTR